MTILRWSAVNASAYKNCKKCLDVDIVCVCLVCYAREENIDPSDSSFPQWFSHKKHFTDYVLWHQQSTDARGERKQISAMGTDDWPVLSSSHIFSWLRPWLDPCLARLWRLPRAEIVNTNSLLRFLTLTDGLVPASWPQGYTTQPPTASNKVFRMDVLGGLRDLDSGLNDAPTVCRLQKNDFGDWYPDVVLVSAQWHEVTEKCPLNTWLLMFKERETPHFEWRPSHNSNAQLYAVEVLKNHWGHYSVTGDNV